MRILLLEDDTELGSMYATGLTRAGHEVVAATSAQDALDYLHEADVDLALVDLMLPLHNGFAFLYELRAYEDWYDLPVIILSNLSRRDLPISEILLKQLGVRDFLVKSRVKPADVVARVAKLGVRE